MIHIKKLAPHLIVFGLFTVVVLAYFSPLLSGKSLVQSDNIQLTGTQREYTDYKAQGEQILWTNTEFSGMPKVTGWEYSPFRIIYVSIQSVLKRPLLLIFTLFIGFYILLRTFDVNHRIAGIGSFAYSFSTFNMLSIEAGHDFKIMAIGLMAPVLAGLFKIYRDKKYFEGGLTLFISAGLQLYFAHVQITYYLLIICLVYFIFELVKAIRNQTTKSLISSTSVVAVVVLLAFGTHAFKYIYLYQYGKSSTRGGSELQSAPNKDGLTKEYAFAWSNDGLETLTLMFPYLKGGSSGEVLSNRSEMYKSLNAQNVDRRSINQVLSRVPLYWGNQPFTGGPIYFGILIFLLFVFGLRYIKGILKWWVLTISILGLVLAMGSNAGFISNVFFDYVPLYNKFRSVTMILCLPQLGFSLLGFVALDRYLKEENRSINDWKAPLMIVGGLCILFLVGKGMMSFSSAKDAQLGYPDWLINALEEDRSRLLRNDILRSFFFIAVFGAAIYLHLKNVLKLHVIIAAVGILVLFDLWAVNRRYLDKSDFISKSRSQGQTFAPTFADQQIQQDKDYYRVFNVTRNAFSDGLTSYHHFSVGGYSGIKLQRYAEIIDRYLGQGYPSVLNMLNVKYFIVNHDNSPVAQRNTDVLGNAWLVNSISVVNSPDEELEGIEELNPEVEAIMDSRFSSYLSNSQKQYSGEGSIRLDSYDPEELIYSFSSIDQQMVVFSEIFYQPGWQAFIDDSPVPHVRVNYILRGMEVPAGDHKITFKYAPPAKTLGVPLEIGSLVVAIAVLVFFYLRQRKKEEIVSEIT